MSKLTKPDPAAVLDDSIIEALREAGPRPPLGALDLEHLSAPALAIWQRRVERRRRQRRSFALVAALMLAALAAWLVVRVDQPSPAESVFATVIAQAGTDFGEGARLAPGHRLTTSAQPAQWLTFELAAGHRLRLDAGSELHLISDSRVELLRGAVYVEASPAALEILAAGSITEHIGTHYEVRLIEGHAAVRVRTGKVRLRLGTEEVEIGRGQAVTAVDTLEVKPWPVHGPSWQWTHHAAPGFDSDGAELKAFLTWIEAETGLRIDIDPALLLDAEGQPVKMRGSLPSLNPEQAWPIMLESAGLEATIAGDRLVITSSR